MDELYSYDLASVFITLEQLNIPISIKRYMEIGVQDGNSTLNVIRKFPDMEQVVLCDNWGPGHGGTNRGSNAYVAQRISDAGFPIGRVMFLDGNSRDLIPMYFQTFPEAYFDLIVVDDDHSVPTLMKHLSVVLGRADFVACHDLCMDGLMNATTLQLCMSNVGSQYVLMLDALTLSKWGIFVKR